MEKTKKNNNKIIREEYNKWGQSGMPREAEATPKILRWGLTRLYSAWLGSTWLDSAAVASIRDSAAAAAIADLNLLAIGGVL